MAASDTTTAERTREAAEFVDRFRAAWAEGSLDELMALGHPDVVLEQPLMPRMVGLEQAREGFARLLAGLPGLRGEVLAWGGDERALFIELHLSAPAGGRPLDWTVVDRIQLEDGLVRERLSYFDPLPLIGKILLRPSLWPAFARANLGR